MARTTTLLALVLVSALVGDLCRTALADKPSDQSYEDNEFAEFEELDEDSEHLTADRVHQPSGPVGDGATAEASDDGAMSKDDEESTVEDEEDDEEFENVSEMDESGERVDPSGGNAKKPDLKITKVPLHLRSNWESYYLEFVMISGLVVYFLNFIAGRSKNQKMADMWFDVHRELLHSNFALVGDDGKKEIEHSGLVKETESVFTLWCSGRVCVEGMLVELKFLKRQDLVNVIANYMKPSQDQILIRVSLNVDAIDSYVFCIASKKSAPRLAKEVFDINTFCPEKKSPEKYGVSGDKYVLLNEIGEAASVLLDAKVVSLLKKYDQCIDYIHFTDSYAGLKTEDGQPIKLPEMAKKMLIFAFNLPHEFSRSQEDMERMKPLLQLVFYSIDKVKRFRLSREGKIKAEKNRQHVEAEYLKNTHEQRQQLAQMKKEERRRLEKEKMLNESDPEKQRKWEEKEYKREMRRKTPKMKQLKVKAM